jgi:hypothetical protein
VPWRLGWAASLPALFGVVTASGGELALSRTPDPVPRLTVLVYNIAGVPPRVLQEATAAAGEIYGKGGVRLHWTLCSEAAASQPQPCRAFLGESGVVLRITGLPRAPQEKPLAAVLGAALVTGGSGGYYASVYYDRIAQVAHTGGIPAQSILGYAIAHEIGHLLLKSTSHSVSGIMRTEWDPADERLAACGRLAFLPEEAVRIRAEVRARSGTSRSR